MLRDEPNPYDHTTDIAIKGSINLCILWKWWRDRKRRKLREKLGRSREQYRKALRRRDLKS